MTTSKDTRNTLASLAGRHITTIEIGEMLGISRNAATSRLQKGLPADDVITLAKSLDVNPVTALVELGHLDESDVLAHLDAEGTLLATASQEQLIYQLAEGALSPAEKIEMGAAAKTLLGQDHLAQRRREKAEKPEVTDLIDELHAGRFVAKKTTRTRYEEPEAP